MRTRRSPKNQEILFKELFHHPEPAAPVVTTNRCWDCRSYPKGGRSRGKCSTSGEVVSGESVRDCFVRRPKR